MNVVTRSSEGATLSGVDRFFTIENIASFKPGALVIDEMFEPGDIPRLRTVAKAFQKVRYHYLRFRIEPQVSTATSGGYVASFIRDPSDIPPTESGPALLNFITAAQGSVTTKWWQKSVVAPKIGAQDFYTSSSVETREYSPGRFVLAVDGQATQQGNLTVFVEWRVTLHTASLESEKSLPVSHVALRDLFVKVEDLGIWGKNGADFASLDINQLIAGARKGLILQLKTPVWIQETTSITRACWFLNCYTATQIRLCKEHPTDFLESGPTTEVLVFKEGTEFEDVTPSPVFREDSSLLRVTRTEPEKISGKPSSSGNSSDWEERLMRSLKRLGDLTENICRLQERSLLRESVRLTDCPRSSGASLRTRSEGDFSVISSLQGS